MHTRISEIVAKLGVTKTEFAKRLGISQAYVSQLCSGVKVPSDRTIADICRVFNVREEWLRYGEGEMEVPAIDEDLSYVNELLGAVDNPLADIIKAIMKVYVNLNPEEQQKAMDFAESLRDEIKKTSRD